MRVIVLAAGFARALSDITLEKTEGAGNTGCFSLTHGLVCKRKHTSSYHRFSRCTGVPCAMVLTLIFVLSPVSVTS
jgi:hypothetical protein